MKKNNNTNRIEIDITKILNTLKLGIYSIDFGKYDVAQNQWVPISRFSTKEGIGLHESITNEYLMNVEDVEPISHWFAHLSNNPIQKEGVIYRTFKVNESILNEYEEISQLEKSDIALYSGDVLGKEQNVYSIRKFISENSASLGLDCYISSSGKIQYGNISELEKFYVSQKLFTNYVAKVYNDQYKKSVIKYVTIILYAYPISGKDFLITHNAAVFSDNETFLKDDAFLMLLAYVTSSKYIDEIDELRLKSFNSALKSAKSAIMSRNMSHNLGSHVMFYIKQKLQSVSKIIDNKVLANIIPGELSDLKTIEQKIKENKDVELPFLVGLGRFINYLQERQDYIATVATDYIPANSTISFKDFVFDELKPDLRYKRHHADNNDAGCQPGNLLLDYIAFSEQYRSSNDIVIKINEFNGENAKDEAADFKELRKFNIAVPGGVIGRQALFSIFENIIRNAAKHSGRRKDNKLVLQLSLLEKDNKLFESENFRCKRDDNKANYDESGKSLKARYEGCFDKYHVLRIKIDMPNDAKTSTSVAKDVADNLVTKLADSYLDENGNMKESSKGLKEMRISAAWLRGYSIDTEIPANEPPALSIYTEPYCDDNSKATISYIVCIPKPCRVAFIDSKHATDAQNKTLALYGCKVFAHEQLNGDNAIKVINEIANYEIVCMSENDKDICSKISSRYIVDGAKSEELLTNLINTVEKTDYDNEETKKDAIEDCIGSIYETWLNVTYPEAIKTKLCVADKKAQDNKKNNCLSNDNNVILTTTGSVKNEEVKNAIVYSTHFKGLASTSEGPDEYNTWLQEAICIESVTGNNSTARLIRQDEWNKKWKTKLIASGLAKVAIFDERIFSSFITRDSKARKDGLTVNVIIETKKKFKKVVDFCNKLFKTYRIEPSDALNLFNAKNDDQICRILNKYSVKYTYDVAQKNHERRIWAFDIRISETNPNEVEIVGYNTCIGDKVGAYEEHQSDAVIPIAIISYDKDKGCVITFCDNNKVFNNGKRKVFDYITIHQGVLDKIYTTFGIKGNAIEKHKVTHALHSCFSKYNTPEDKKAFLPNFIIHSGRSKPSADDMPQHQPFVQFAAVDHAVKDCKYTLVELLATAHYEKGNNNN